MYVMFVFYVDNLFILLQLQELRKLISSYDKQVNSMKTEIDQKVLFHYNACNVIFM